MNEVTTEAIGATAVAASDPTSREVESEAEMTAATTSASCCFEAGTEARLKVPSEVTFTPCLAPNSRSAVSTPEEARMMEKGRPESETAFSATESSFLGSVQTQRETRTMREGWRVLRVARGALRSASQLSTRTMVASLGVDSAVAWVRSMLWAPESARRRRLDLLPMRRWDASVASRKRVNMRGHRRDNSDGRFDSLTAHKNWLCDRRRFLCCSANHQGLESPVARSSNCLCEPCIASLCDKDRLGDRMDRNSASASSSKGS